MSTSDLDASVSSPAPPASRRPTINPGSLHSALIKAFLENVPDAVYFKDTDSRFIAVSKSKAARHGFENPDELVGRSDFDLFASVHAERSRSDEEEIIRTGRPVLGRIEEITWPDGRVTWSASSKLPLRDEDGRVIGTFGISRDITQARKTELELERARKDLIESSRQAGMAEVATGVLHNVGNVLNSVNVAASIIAAGLREQKSASLGQLAALLQSHAGDLGEFLVHDPKGRRVPEYLGTLARHFASEQTRLLQEIETLQKNIDHIKDIVSMQQAYATRVSILEAQDVRTLLEDAVRMNSSAFARHDVKIVRDYQPVPLVMAEKSKVLQILVNLLRNAKHACDDSPAMEKTITLGISLSPDEHYAQVIVTDNGVGIAAGNLARIFEHGFTTRAYGHGFGLHSSILAAKEMKGDLTAGSAGPGQGATFTLKLPLAHALPCAATA